MTAPSRVSSKMCVRWCLAMLPIAMLVFVAVTTDAMKSKEDIVNMKLKEETLITHSSDDYSDNKIPDAAKLKQLFALSSSNSKGGLKVDPEQKTTSSSRRRLADILDLSHGKHARLLTGGDSFSCPNPEWTQVGLDIPGEDAGNDFGVCVAMSADGQIIAVGSRFHIGSGSPNGGTARVFLRNDTDPLGWVQIGKDLVGDSSGDWFGHSVALSDDGQILAVGGDRHNANGINSGHVRVFERDSSSSLGWKQIGQNIDGADGDHFGRRVALSGSGNIIAVGAYGNNLVRVYQKNPLLAIGWEQLGEDLHGGSTTFDVFGWTVSLSNNGETLAIGGHHYDENRGRVRVYRRDSARTIGWLQVGEDFIGGPGDHFGSVVRLSNDGDVLAINSAWSDGINGENSGHVSVFQRNSSSIIGWDQVGGNLEGDVAGDYFGQFLALSANGDIIAIGSSNINDGSNYGQVTVYRKNPLLTLGWEQIGSNMNGDRGTYNYFGSQLAISGNGELVVIGAVSHSHEGYVRVIQACNQTSSTVTDSPSKEPSSHPSNEPSNLPTLIPSATPSFKPSVEASNIPTLIPSIIPSAQPSLNAFSWDLELDTPGYLKSPAIQDGVYEFVTAYNMSKRDYEVEVFKSDCETPSTGLPLASTSYNAINALEVSFLYNQSIVQTSNLWSANSTGGEVNFCIKTSLYTSGNESDRILFNFIETVYKIEVDLTAGFTSSVEVIRSEAGNGGVEVINVDENITAFQCNDSFDKLLSPPPLTQGSYLQICVETEGDSVFEVGKIKDVTISQNGTKSFDYVSSYRDSYWALTSCMAVNTTASKCKVKVQLLGEYFNDADPNPVDLVVEGVVKLDYLGRRVLHAVEGGRGDGAKLRKRVLIDEDESNAMFILNVAIGGADSSTVTDETDGNIGGKDVADPMVGNTGVRESPNGFFYGSIFFTLIAVVATNIWMGK